MKPQPNRAERDKLLVAKTLDKLKNARERHKSGFSFFMSMRQAAVAEKVLKNEGYQNFLFFGGYKDAERVVLGIFSEFEEPNEEAFGIIPVTISFSARSNITHRDILGALMGQNVARETVGDILVDETHAVAFLTESAAHEALMLTKVGRANVSVSEGFCADELPVPKFKDISGTVSSLRADCVTALAVGVSRSKAEELCGGGAVIIRGKGEVSASKKLCEGDVFTVSKHGKFILDKVGNKTKKERICINIKKFV